MRFLLGKIALQCYATFDESQSTCPKSSLARDPDQLLPVLAGIGIKVEALNPFGQRLCCRLHIDARGVERTMTE